VNGWRVGHTLSAQAPSETGKSWSAPSAASPADRIRSMMEDFKKTYSVAIEGAEREKIAVLERCASLEGEVEMTIQAAVQNEQTIRTEMHQRIQMMLQEIALSQKLLDDERSERIHLLNLNDSLSAELSHLKDEKAALLATIALSQKLLDDERSERIHLLNLNVSLSAELSHLKDEKAALLATFESLSDEHVLVSKTQPQQVRCHDLDPLDKSLADLISSPLPESGSPQAPPGMC
jgi:hypothetical protein